MTKVAVVGSGGWGKNHVRVFHQLDALWGVAELDEKRRAEQAALYPEIQLVKKRSGRHRCRAGGSGGYRDARRCSLRGSQAGASGRIACFRRKTADFGCQPRPRNWSNWQKKKTAF